MWEENGEGKYYGKVGRRVEKGDMKKNDKKEFVKRETERSRRNKNGVNGQKKMEEMEILG